MDYYSATYNISPWYNRTGWLGVKHQVTYLLDYSTVHYAMQSWIVSVDWGSHQNESCMILLLLVSGSLHCCLAYFICVLTQCVSPWCNRTGWLGVTKLLTYLLTYLPITPYKSCNQKQFLWTDEAGMTLLWCVLHDKSTAAYNISPWYKRTGWLGIKHQVTYLLTYNTVQYVMQSWTVSVDWGSHQNDSSLMCSWWQRRPDSCLDSTAGAWQMVKM